MTSLSFFGEVLEYGQMLIVRVQLTGGKQEVLGEVTVIVRRNG